MDQPGKVANPARGQLNWEKGYSLSPFAPENFVSRDGFGSPVPRQRAHLHTRAESGAYLRDSSRYPRRRPFIYLYRHTPSGQSRVYRVTQLRTDGLTPVLSTCPLHTNGGCGKKKSAYQLVHGDLPRQHPFGTTLRFTGPVPADSGQ